MKNIRSVALAVSTASLLTGTIPVLGDESIDELKAMIRELDQKVRVLERKQEQEKEALAEKAKSAPTLSAGANGFKIQSADTNFTLRVGLHLQADGRFYPGGPANNTFLLRKVRPIFEGTVFDKF